MTDVLLSWNNQLGIGGLSTVGADLALDDGILTAVLLSLFTDRRADPGDLPPGQSDRRGSWQDTLADDEAGSHLWLLEREKPTPDVPPRAEQYATEALEWMVADGVLRSVAASAEFVGEEILGLFVDATLPSGESVEFQFDVGL